MGRASVSASEEADATTSIDWGPQPVRSSPRRTARCGKPSWSFTRDSRSSAQAKTTCPSSMKDAVASLSNGLIPRTRMVALLKMTCDFAHRGGPELGPLRQRLTDLFHAGEQPGLGLGGGRVMVLARRQRRAVNREADARQVPVPQLSQEGEHPFP